MQLLLQVIRAGVAPVMVENGKELFNAMHSLLVELSGGKPTKKPNDKNSRRQWLHPTQS